MPKRIDESEVEKAVLDIFGELEYDLAFGPDIAVDGITPERESYASVILADRLKLEIDRLNKSIPAEARSEALKRVLRSESQVVAHNNKAFHKMLTEGVQVEYKRADGTIVGDNVRLVDFEHPGSNNFLAVNQFTIIENNNNRRPDVILFVNGIPFVVIELKNPADENATLDSALSQLETYKVQIPTLFTYNGFLIISDGTQAKAGTITSNREWFMPWKAVDREQPVPNTMSQVEILLKGMCSKTTLLDLFRHFIVFEQDGNKISKKIAAYHQYHAVNKAIEKTIIASKSSGDKRCGVVWHTQGSGKSLSMVFYAGKLVLEPALENPTIIVLTDRNDLDDQLFGTFSRCNELLRQKPVQAETREHLKELLAVASGGIIFTTAQKFLPKEKGGKYPLLSDRRNMIVIADEAHRSQYDFIDGFARHLRDAVPNASFIGFTGTPIEKADRNTLAVFGDYIDIYDIEQAVRDGATVRLYYESRLAKLDLSPSERPKIDPSFEEVTEKEEVERKEKLKSKWARMEAVVGSEKRLKQIARDLVNHFETRLDYFVGKGMIVCMSRRICIDLYNEIVKLRPQWEDEDDKRGFLKVIMTGSASDPVEWQKHIRNKPRRRELGERMKDANDPLKLAIVRDMWLTGFDVPSLHTMYVDKPMRGHTLMQAIARADRVFKDKEGGLIVDYIGIADDLKKALAEYTDGDKKQTAIPIEEAVAIMQEKYEIVCNLFHGFNYKPIFSAPPKGKLAILTAAGDYILRQKDGKERCLKHVTELSQAFALAVPHPDALKIKDDLAFFQAVRSGLAKTPSATGKSQEELDSAVKQIVSKAITAGNVIDLFTFAGLPKPDISILSPEFLAEVRGLQHKNLALEVLRKLLNDEIRVRQKKNLIQGRVFSEMLEQTIARYQNKSIETAEVIDELIELAKKMREANQRGEQLNLSEDEVAFYDALEVNDSAVKILGDEALRAIARELTDTVRNNVTIDWTLRENVQAKLRVLVKRVLRKHNYPPDKQKKATDTILLQATMIAKDWAEPK